MELRPPGRVEGWTHSSAGIALIYALVGVLWIILSDRVVAASFPAPIHLIVSSAKGTVYVIATSAMLFFLVRRSRRELKKRARGIEEREERLRALVDAIAEEVWECDRDGRMSLLNVGHRPPHMGLLEFTGKTVHEVLEEVDIFIEEGKKRPPEEAPLLRSLKGEVVRGEEIMKHRQTGVTRNRQFTSSPIHDADGRITGAVAVVRDITENKELERALVQAKQEAEAANAAKDQFLAVLSHELRTPLTPVLAAISLMKKQGNLPEKVLEHLDLIKRNVSVEARLIDDLLDLTRIVRGKVSLEKASIDVCDTLRQVAEVCQPDVETKNLHFEVELEEAQLFTYADSSRLQQVFWNLVKNAIKFTPEGGRVGIVARSENGAVIVEVNDSGIGIEAEVLPKIFDAFEQGGQGVTRQFGGLGLGLAITKRLVLLHDGTISAHSQGKGQGATFRVVLPLMQKQPKEKEVENVLPAAGTKQILLVEDHGDTAVLMRALLEGLGHRVELAGDVAEALKVATRTRLDLLISDLGLPDGSGVDLMRELRQRGIYIAGIALSGFGREEDVRKSKEAGFVEHITKPVDFEVLERALDRVAAGSTPAAAA